MSTTAATALTKSFHELSPEVDQFLFSWIDYIIFVVMLAISTIIGIYFGFFGKKQDNIAEYILAGKSMNIWPVAMSLVASEIADISILSADVYSYGASNWLNIISMSIAGVVTSSVYLPVYFKLQLTSTYEYLTHRFDGRVRSLSSFFFIFSMVTCMPIIIFIPALAFNQATGVNVHFITPIVCSICIFYTTVGGLRAVVWTDTFQFIVMVVALLVVLILGLNATGNIEYVFQKSYDGGRLYLWNMNPDPTIRTSFWSVVIGMGSSWSSYMSCNQNCIQKFRAVPTLVKAKQTIVIFVLVMFTFNSCCMLSGLIIYAKYWDCDPVTTKQIKQADQIVPYFIMSVAGKIPGLPGLFIAGVFCGALSTMSAGLNTMAAVIYEDFIKSYMPENTTEKRASDIMKCVVVIVGILPIGMVYIVEHLGSLFALAVTMGGMIDGPMMGMFTLGMLVPFANSTGTLTGAIGGLMFIGWIIFGGQYYTALGAVHTPLLPTSIEGCEFSYFNNVTSNATSDAPIVAPWIYRISFYYFALIGGSVTIIIGVIVSLLTGGRNQHVDKDLLSPVIYFLLPKEDTNNHNSVAMDVLAKENAKLGERRY